MDRAMNTLPIRDYVRQRICTIVTDVGGQSSGSIPLNLAKPSDVTVIIVSDSYSGQPTLFIAAVGREPTLADFDVIVSPIDEHYVKDQSRVTLSLPAGSTTLQWKGIGTDGTADAFPSTCSRIVLAVDQ
jgi:hypothetical protein